MQLQKVFDGEDGDFRWTIEAGEVPGGFATFLKVYRLDGTFIGGTGFGGPKLSLENPIRASWGGHSEGPAYVKVRAAPHIDKVVAVTSDGNEVTLSLSQVIAEFGLKFGAAPIPEGCSVTKIYGLSGGVEVAAIKSSAI